ncbi:hypothetical protein [Nannocystis radixulma]|uniref:Lipoprotein n=1 Tax=Nannocystis radixulma TaxID=2995305 RepID=A0ABT5BPC7_9BACT|nr:hypothetical protein [Nannocystis radixulma]MDC0676024.1 hypothetical protein [Nannocystis radixulma]
MIMRILLRSLLPALALASGCRDSDAGGTEDTGSDEVQRAARGELQWKRNAALQRDLMRALELPEDGVCNELGRGSCTREIHHIALGAADPIRIGLYKPLPDTLVSTPIVLDRVVMSACVNRANLDGGGSPVVFTELDFGEAAPAADDEVFTDTVTALYRRLLSRDPEPHELTTLGGLTVDDAGKPVSAHEFAVLTCFAIGTSSEFLFF